MITPKSLTGIILTPVGATTYYTCPVNTKAIGTKLTLLNYSAGAETITPYLVESGGTAGNSNMIEKTKTIGTGETIDLSSIVNHVMLPGDTLQIACSTVSTVSMKFSYYEVT